MKTQDYPNYYQAGNNASSVAQKIYTRFVKWDLLAMVLAALIAIYNYESEYGKTFLYCVSGILMLIATIFSLVIKNKKYEDIWYRGRALAESCKTLTWRFMMCSELFESSLNQEEVERSFIKRAKEIYDQFEDLTSSIDSKILSLPIISDKMKEVRGLPLIQRKQYYVDNRIKEQINWYSNKAEANKYNYEIWFWIVIVSQILSLISIFFLIKFPMSNWNIVGFFTTVSSAGFSWLQLKRFQENKEAYTTAVSELNHIAQDSNYIATEESFVKFVLDSENAISREHTMWLAQKRG